MAWAWGVSKDEVESVRWHTKAADNGNAASQLSRGMFYMSGGGVPKNEAEGVKWLRKAAEQGNADGEFWLGAAYNSGTGVAKDSAQALRWYRMAGDQGNAAAQYNLGQAYNLGNGVEKDITEAARWWQKAAEQGLEAAGAADATACSRSGCFRCLLRFAWVVSVTEIFRQLFNFRHSVVPQLPSPCGIRLSKNNDSVGRRIAFRHYLPFMQNRPTTVFGARQQWMLIMFFFQR